jgi:hypothetical protein
LMSGGRDEPTTAYRSASAHSNKVLHVDEECVTLDGAEVSEVVADHYRPHWDWCRRCAGDYDFAEAGAVGGSEEGKLSDRLKQADSLEELREGSP